MKVIEISEYLISNLTSIKEVSTFSALPGIYALSFIGQHFPLKGFVLPKNKIIYIGKTESSQQSRDANTHFKSGKTGSSTVRKSIGALLSQSEEIIPIIRSITDIEKGRTSHYKFDAASEEKVTQWMLDNLAVSFYEYPASKQEINELETDLITLLKPVLNIDAKNSTNPELARIRTLRKKLGIIAHTEFIHTHKTLGTKKVNEIKVAPKMMIANSASAGKYIGIWTAYLEDIKTAINSGMVRSVIQLDKRLFQQAGNRSNYSFRLGYTNAQVSNNIGGSAVARDLDKVLRNNKIHPGNKTFKMNTEFKLTIE